MKLGPGKSYFMIYMSLLDLYEFTLLSSLPMTNLLHTNVIILFQLKKCTMQAFVTSRMLFSYKNKARMMEKCHELQ